MQYNILDIYYIMSNNDLDIDELLHALDNENNASIIKLTTRKIKDQKNNILQQLQLPREKLKELHKKLQEYRYVNDIDDIEYGRYIRWIPLKDPEKIKLTNGAIVCDLRIFNKQIHIRCKNNLHHMMQLILDECIVFQKLTDQEKVVLSVLDHLEKGE
tara:strand:+ start:36 stop:509 length:474 start_codon:yes stop_codon:yes gene_type:complete